MMPHLFFPIALALVILEYLALLAFQLLLLIALVRVSRKYHVCFLMLLVPQKYQVHHLLMAQVLMPRN